jgi:flagellar M-ring protein FliF
MEGVKDATVIINKPASDYSIFESDKATSVSVILDLSAEITDEQAQYMAMWIANAMGSENADNVVILDSQRNLLYGGAQEELLGGAISDKEEYKQKLTNQINYDVETMMMKAEFDDVSVTSNMQYNFDKLTEQYTEYTPAEGQEQGVYSHSYQYASKGSSGSGGIPGTESNDEDTDYMLETNGSTDTQVTLDKYDYLPNTRIQNIEYEIGAVLPDESSMSVVLTKYQIYNEEDLERQGLLDGTTFEDFILANNTRTATEVDEQYYELISSATGISTDNITIMAYIQPVFNEKTSTPFEVTNYLMIILAVLIIALLIFVVFRGTAPVEVTEMEPELSVEQLLATTKENQSLEDIEFSEKSETRRLIEKFVDENPEAVATLLRNWLQDDWG